MSPLPRTTKRFLVDRKGGTAIEFALVAPIFLVCAFALFQVAFGIYSQATIAQIAEQGARHLLFRPGDVQGARQVMLTALNGTALNPQSLSIATRTVSAPYRHLELTVRYMHQPFGPIALPEDVPLQSVANIPLSEE